jgi:hypothetical protein
MASEQEGVPIVAIDSSGVFKYILIKVTTDKGVFNIVRGSDLPNRISNAILSADTAGFSAPHTLFCKPLKRVSRSSQICLGGVSRRHVPARVSGNRGDTHPQTALKTAQCCL